MTSKSKKQLNSKTKARLGSLFDWLASLVLLLISLVFIYSSQVFQEQKLQAWANVFTTVGSVMLSLISLHMGSRLQQAKDRQEERRATRRAEATIHQDYIQKVSDLIAQLQRADLLNISGKQDESDLITYHVREKILAIQENKPSANNITDEYFRCKIEEAMQRVTQYCDDLATDPFAIKELEIAIQHALTEIQQYETVE